MKRLLLAAGFVAATFAAPATALADSPQHLVDSATLSLEDMMTGPGSQQIESVLRKARAVVICPNIFKAGFIFGGEGGGCVMVARSADGWTDPAFYGLGGGSFGFQAGVQSEEVMMFVMTQNGLDALLNSQFKIGADAGLTVATIGGGVNGSMSAGLEADILTVSKSQGLYGGLSLAGSILSTDSKFDQAYYGTPIGSRAIVIGGQGANPGANPLRSMLSRYGG